MKRRKLPEPPLLALDAKMVNLLRYHQLLTDELSKPQKKAIFISSMMSEQRDAEEMIVERLAWLFNDQFPRTKFIWGKIQKNSKLPDKMPVKLQHAVKRYKDRNGL